ncbi:MAG TPA: hypothetical protein VFR31_03655 [Thermoanaerobaculia bacterium]|nr:hypothetical protein [Thermoanaerobaculia bacterium]
MSRVKWVLVVALVLCSSPVFASEAAPVSSPYETQVVPAVLHLPGPGEEPLYSSIQFAKAPPVLPGNVCEARCLTGFRQCPAGSPCDFLLDLCTAGCADCV